MNPWKYTPRQMFFWLQLIVADKRRDESRMVQLNAISAQGGQKNIEDMIKQLEKDDQ